MDFIHRGWINLFALRESKVLGLSVTYYKCYLDTGSIAIKGVPHPFLLWIFIIPYHFAEWRHYYDICTTSMENHVHSPQWLWLRAMSTRAKVSRDTVERDILLSSSMSTATPWMVFHSKYYPNQRHERVIDLFFTDLTLLVKLMTPFLFTSQVSFAATSPALSNREEYPTFYRLVAADSSHNAARKTFIQHFGWNTVATIHQDSEIFSLVYFISFICFLSACKILQ